MFAVLALRTVNKTKEYRTSKMSKTVLDRFPMKIAVAAVVASTLLVGGVATAAEKTPRQQAEELARQLMLNARVRAERQRQQMEARRRQLEELRRQQRIKELLQREEEARRRGRTG